jgi:hypothetical protein
MLLISDASKWPIRAVSLRVHTRQVLEAVARERFRAIEYGVALCQRCWSAMQLYVMVDSDIALPL